MRMQRCQCNLTDRLLCSKVLALLSRRSAILSSPSIDGLESSSSLGSATALAPCGLWALACALLLLLSTGTDAQAQTATGDASRQLLGKRQRAAQASELRRTG